METRARHLAVGGFVLVLVICAGLFAIWAAKFSGQVTFLPYYTRFGGSVSQLRIDTTVLFGGIPALILGVSMGLSRPLRMMVDTGASSIVLTYDDAMRLGINADNLVFSIEVSTANGRAMAAPVTLRQVAIGPIMRGTIRGMVTQPGQLDQSLLGMSFLETLGSIEITRDELRLKD